MWFRIFVAAWSIALLTLLGYLASHQSSDPRIFSRYSPHYFALLLGVAALATISVLAQWPFFYRRLYSWRWKIIQMISAGVISLLMVELAIRTLDPLGISYFQETSRYELDKLPDPVLVYKHTPGLVRTYQGVRVSINELGMRDRSLGKKQEGEFRILLLGDSVTFGWGVPIEATFGRKLETKLAAQLGRPVRTINAGVGGYNTVQEYAVLRAYADIVKPDAVILLYVRNDIQPNDPPFDPWSQLSLQGKSLPEAMTILLGKSWLYRLAHFSLLYSRRYGTASLDKNARGLRESMDALAAIAAFCRARNIGFVTFYYRSMRDPWGELSSALFSKIQLLGQTYHFSVADVGPWWGDTNIRSVTNSTVDVHPNERGHEILAAGMLNFLMTHGLADTMSATAQ
jgi:lysophospholipase L1-like esterase